MSPAIFITAELIFVGLPFATVLYMAHRFFNVREKKLDVEARLVAEKAAQYAASNKELEQRVRVLEQIATDSGVQTASQIEALRERSRITSKSVQES